MNVEWLDRSLVLGPHLTLCTTPEMYDAAMDHLKVPRTDRLSWIKTPQADATAHIIESRGKLACVVCIRPPESADVDGIAIAGLLVHEAVHVWQHFRADIGEREPSAEFEAWSIQQISQQLMWEYIRQTMSKRVSAQ